MNRRSARPLSTFIALCVLTTLAPGSSAATAPTPKLKQAIVKKIGTLLERNAFAFGTDWRQWPTLVEAHREAIDAAATEDEFGAALDGALAEFGVSHLWVWTPRDLELRKRGKQGGLGLKTVDVERGKLVTMVLPESPAETAGILKGDLLAGEVPGSGPVGQPVTVAWERGGERLEAELRFASARRAAQPSLSWLGEDIAWLTVPTFSYGVYRPEAIEELFAEAARARAMVLDLRSNGGGRGANVEHLLGYVLKPGQAVFGEIYRPQYDRFVRRMGRRPDSVTELVESSGQIVRSPEGITDSPYLRPLAVLVDGRSGSGGDVFPATIQSLGRGLIIGTPTAGKTLSGDDAKLPGGYVLFFPHAEIVRIDGKRMEANPVQPDVLLSAEQTVNDDYLGQLLRKTFERSP